MVSQDNLATTTSKPGAIHLRIVEVMKRFPKGISGGQIRQELEKKGLQPEEQTHLDRRKRDLKKWFVIQKTKAEQITTEGKKRNVVLYQVAIAPFSSLDMHCAFPAGAAQYNRPSYRF